MERPGSFSAEDISHEKVVGQYSEIMSSPDDVKVRVLRLIPPIEFVDTIVGQYSRSSDGEKPGYKDDDTVPKDSRCATFCAAVAYIKSSRWDRVPFILKAGKGRFSPRYISNTC